MKCFLYWAKTWFPLLIVLACFLFFLRSSSEPWLLIGWVFVGLLWGHGMTWRYYIHKLTETRIQYIAALRRFRDESDNFDRRLYAALSVLDQLQKDVEEGEEWKRGGGHGSA